MPFEEERRRRRRCRNSVLVSIDAANITVEAGTEAHSVSIATIAEVHAATRGRLGQERGVRIRDISRLWCEAYHKLASI